MQSSGDSPLVSAIIPAYNCAPYIAAAVESVLEQTYSPVECIVVDDGSTDDTPALVTSKFGSTVRLIGQTNLGVSVARNRGARAAQGKYLAFLDADDLWLPEKTAKQVAVLEDNPSLAYAYSAYWFVDENLDPIELETIPLPEDAHRNAATLTSPSINLAQTGMVRSTVFREVGGFDENLSTSADLDFVLRVTATYDSAGLEEPLAMYRRHEHQMSQDAARMQNDMEQVLAKYYASSPGSGLRLDERRAYANLYRVVAATYLQDRKFAQGCRFLAKSLLRDPRAAARGSVRSFVKLLQVFRRGSAV